MSSDRGGINRALAWLKRVLEITEVTRAPDNLLPAVRPTIDLFGWERLGDQSEMTSSGTVGATTVNGLSTPDDTLRLVLHAAVNHTDVVARVCWMEKRLPTTSNTVGLTPALNLPLPLQPNPILEKLILSPGDFLVARAGSMGVAAILQLRVNFIDLPIGEYITSW